VGHAPRTHRAARLGAVTMRVLLVSAEYPPQPGGVGDYTALLAKHLAESGASVAVLTSGDGSVVDDGVVRVHRTVARWHWDVVRTVRATLTDERPDVLHIQYQTGMYGMHPGINALPNLLGRRNGGQGRPAIVTTFHDLLHPYLFPKAGPLRPQVTRHLARASMTAIATNGADLATLRGWGANAALIPIGSNIPLALNVDRDAIRARYGVPPDALLLTTFGLVQHTKGLDTLVDALDVLRSAGRMVHLLLVGGGSAAIESISSQTETMTHTGALPADDVALALAASDVCLLPYDDGASPRRGSLLAALTQGVPVVTTRPHRGVYDGLPELRDGDGALFVPPRDPRALAEAVCHIADNRNRNRNRTLAGRLAVGARAYAAQFAWPEIARQTLAVYARIGAAPMPVAALATGAGVER